MATPESSSFTGQNVVERLEQAVLRARSLGFHVRFEFLDGQDATWCEVNGKKSLFIDCALPTAEQLTGLNRALNEFLAQSRPQAA
jgi:hypothetical protein